MINTKIQDGGGEGLCAKVDDQHGLIVSMAGSPPVSSQKNRPFRAFFTNPELTTDVQQGTDSNYYECTKTHWQQATTRPVTGATWKRYWKPSTETTETKTYVEGTVARTNHTILVNGSTTGGNFDSVHNSDEQFGDGVADATNIGVSFTSWVSGDVASVKIEVTVSAVTFNAVAAIYSDDGNATNPSPLAQVGGNSDTVDLNAVQEFTFSWSANAPTLTKDTKYWVVITDTDGGTGDMSISMETDMSNPYDCGKDDTVTAIDHNQNLTNTGEQMRLELIMDTSTTEEFELLAASDSDRYITQVSFLIADAGAVLNEFGNFDELINGCEFAYVFSGGETVFNGELKTNWDFVRMCLGTPPVGDSGNSFRASNVSGSAEGYTPTLNLLQIMPPWGLKLEKGTKQRLVLRIKDKTQNIDDMNVIAYGFERFE